MLKYFLVLIIGFSTGYYYYFSVEKKDFKDNIIMVKQSFKIGCEIGILSRQEGLSAKPDKKVSLRYLENNSKVLNKLIKKTK